MVENRDIPVGEPAGTDRGRLGGQLQHPVAAEQREHLCPVDPAAASCFGWRRAQVETWDIKDAHQGQDRGGGCPTGAEPGQSQDLRAGLGAHAPYRRFEVSGGQQDIGCSGRTTDPAGFGADPAVGTLAGRRVRPPSVGRRLQVKPLLEQLP